MRRKRTKLEAQPRTRARDRVGILKAVIRAIRAEPLRYDQSDWLSVYPEDSEMIGHGAPACGTVGCVAGWVCVLTRPRTEGTFKEYSQAATIAGLKLNLQGMEEYGLFSGGAIPSRFHVGTPVYAAAGVAHIENFLREHSNYRGKVLLTKKEQAMLGPAVAEYFPMLARAIKKERRRA